jgi:hypothetical protein
VFVTTRLADKVREVEGAAQAFVLTDKGKFQLKGKGELELLQATSLGR